MLTEYFVYIFLGILPSAIWLFFYLRKDGHPEPKRKVLEIFFGGMIAAILAAALETITMRIFDIKNATEVYRIFYIFLGIALVEECLKYLIAEERVFKSREFDEPTDAIVYLIVSGLGFAALENVLLFFSQNLQFSDTVLVASLRFAGATLLHALSSGILGYFVALSFLKSKNRSRLFLIGLLLATLLHGLYNFFIMKTDKSWKLLFPTILLFVFSLFLSFCFRKLNKTESVCETKNTTNNTTNYE